MNALLLGNGFDIHYGFATRYISFLNTINFIKTNTLIDVQTVADIFGQDKLRSQDKYIAESYKRHAEIYRSTPLSMEVVTKLSQTAESNMWYTYLWNSYSDDIRWIDFEARIGEVLSAFKELIDGLPLPFDMRKHIKTPLSRHILRQFGYFLEHEGGSVYTMKEEYLLEIPRNSGIYRVDVDKWIGELKEALDEFTEMLRLYLYHFVEQPMLNIPSSSMNNEWFVKLNPEFVVTFNYTSTFEHFFSSASVAHIHGTVQDKIVLGVNPDDDDEVDTADTLCLDFKKYVQRILLNTDKDYRYITDLMNDGANDLLLTVMGHSLDITDEDIIREMFDLASEIIIICHSPSAKRDYIGKMITLYGKDEFDVMCKEKRLKFCLLGQELDECIKAVLERSLIHLSTCTL